VEEEEIRELALLPRRDGEDPETDQSVNRAVALRNNLANPVRAAADAYAEELAALIEQAPRCRNPTGSWS
jgi:hypothetical protein